MTATAESPPVAVAAPAPAPIGITSPWPRRLLPAVAALLVAGTLLRYGFSTRSLVVAPFLVVLAVLSVIDLETRLLPNKIVLPAAAVALVAQIALHPDQAVEWIGSSFGAAFFLLLAALAKPGGLGMGDVKLALLLGAVLGSDVVVALLLGFGTTWPVFIVLLIRHGRAALKRTIPLGPGLAVAAGFVALLHSPVS